MCSEYFWFNLALRYDCVRKVPVVGGRCPGISFCDQGRPHENTPIWFLYLR